jgi:uncharacterized protein YkwD
MKVRSIGLLALSCALGLFATLSPSLTGHTQTSKALAGDGMSQDERELLSEINEVRAHPQEYIAYLQRLKPLFNGKQYKTATMTVTTEEGWSAVEDAIEFLRATKPVPALTRSGGLCQAALTHIKDQSTTGTTGHKGNDNSFIEQRVKPFGTWQGGIGENLTYGNESARERLLTWLIDDGFASRGHRRRLMSPDYKVAGVCCGPHPQYNSMCAITLAGGFTDLQPTTTTATPPAKSTTPASKSKTAKKSGGTN